MYTARLYVAETNFCETADYAEEFSGQGREPSSTTRRKSNEEANSYRIGDSVAAMRCGNGIGSDRNSSLR
jgi:hypothetical protein